MGRKGGGRKGEQGNSEFRMTNGEWLRALGGGDNWGGTEIEMAASGGALRNSMIMG